MMTATLRRHVHQPVRVFEAARGALVRVLRRSVPLTRDDELAIAAAGAEKRGHNLTRVERNKRARELAGDDVPVIHWTPRHSHH